MKRTYLSEREAKRAAVFLRVVNGGWALLEAAKRMEVSYRQAKRLWKRYRAEGAAGWATGLDPQQMRQIALAPGSKGLDSLRERFSRPLLELMAIVGLVLLTACASENQAGAKGLLEEVVRRGVRPDRKYLFPTDGSRAL